MIFIALHKNKHEKRNQKIASPKIYKISFENPFLIHISKEIYLVEIKTAIHLHLVVDHLNYNCVEATRAEFKTLFQF